MRKARELIRGIVRSKVGRYVLCFIILICSFLIAKGIPALVDRIVTGW